MPGDERTGEVEHCEVGVGAFLPAGEDATEAMQSGVCAFDDPACGSPLLLRRPQPPPSPSASPMKTVTLGQAHQQTCSISAPTSLTLSDLFPHPPSSAKEPATGPGL